MHEKNKPGLIKKSINISQKSLEILLVVFSVAIVVLVSLQVLFRYVFFHAISWSEELALPLMALFSIIFLIEWGLRLFRDLLKNGEKNGKSL